MNPQKLRRELKQSMATIRQEDEPHAWRLIVTALAAWAVVLALVLTVMYAFG